MVFVKTILSTLGSSEIRSQIKVFENQYRGRELPGFVNYKTFENIIKTQIKALEEPAVDMLHKVTGECTQRPEGTLYKATEVHCQSLPFSWLVLSKAGFLHPSQMITELGGRRP